MEQNTFQITSPVSNHSTTEVCDSQSDHEESNSRFKSLHKPRSLKIDNVFYNKCTLTDAPLSDILRISSLYTIHACYKTTAHRTCRRWRSPERTRRRSEALHWTDQLQNIFVAQAQTQRQQERFRDDLVIMLETRTTFQL